MNWPAEDLWQALVPHCAGITVEVLPEIDSTNSELMRRARAGQTDPVLLLAETQTAGRGRLGRAWHGKAGDALTFTLGLMLKPADWSGLSLSVGLALARGLDPQGVLGLRLKWPNDLWVTRPDTPSGWGKLAGILIETTLTTPAEPQAARFCVVGMGVNLAPPVAADLSTAPVGLCELDPHASAGQALLRCAPAVLQTLLAFERAGFAPLQNAFHARDALNNAQVRLSDGRSGLACGVDAQGGLRVQTASGLEVVTSAEVSVRPHTLSERGVHAV
jgi:BirA family biotin operon repressor/biotin-[acetyl-CoA-carboxylase] ligase